MNPTANPSYRQIKRILTDAHDTARDILTKHRADLESVTRRLLEIEVMEGDELRKMLGIEATTPRIEAVPLPATD